MDLGAHRHFHTARLGALEGARRHTGDEAAHALDPGPQLIDRGVVVGVIGRLDAGQASHAELGRVAGALDLPQQRQHVRLEP